MTAPVVTHARTEFADARGRLGGSVGVVMRQNAVTGGNHGDLNA